MLRLRFAAAVVDLFWEQMKELEQHQLLSLLWVQFHPYSYSYELMVVVLWVAVVVQMLWAPGMFSLYEKRL